MMSQINQSGRKEFPILVKADVQGSAEAIVQALEKIGNEEIRSRVVHYAVGGISESDISLAAASGADAVLMVRLLRVDTKTQVSTMMVPGGGFGPYGGFYGGFYGGPGFYPVTDVTQYDVASVETNLYDARTRNLIWAGTTETINPSDVGKQAPGFPSGARSWGGRGGLDHHLGAVPDL